MGRQAVAADRPKKRIVVVAERSLIVEAIAIGLRNSGEFTVLGCVLERTGQTSAIVEQEPDVVLVDDEFDGSADTLELIRRVKGQRPAVVAIIMTTSMNPDWLDAVFGAGAAGAISKAAHPAAIAALVLETVNGNILHVHKALSAARRAGAVGGAAAPSLTARETDVLQLLASGSTNAEIARKLWITEQTVKFHLSNVYRKFNVGNRTEASHFALVNGLVDGAARTPSAGGDGCRLMPVGMRPSSKEEDRSTAIGTSSKRPPTLST